MAERKRSFLPISGNVLPRFAGIPTFMRLPHIPLEEAAQAGVEVGLIGVPWDGGTTNRPGARHGPRQMRDQSTLMRNVHHTTGVQPYRLANCADLGDTPINPVDLADSLTRIEKYFDNVARAGIVPLSAGGDHLITLPILRALSNGKPLGLVHFDAHGDTWDRYFGDHKFTHGTPFRRAIEDGAIDPRRTVQIGIRGSRYAADDDRWAEEQGIRVISIDEMHEIGIKAVIAEARRVVGDAPIYVSFDVDGLDPVYAPGTGTPEIGGFSTFEAQQMVRGLRHLEIVGGDVVEVSPPLDPSGMTALVGVTMMWEILCLIAERIGKLKGRTN